MCVSQIGGGTLAAAVLGVGTMATTPAHAAPRVAAVEVARQLAATGTNATVALALFGTLLVIAGLMLMSLSKRHAPRERMSRHLTPRPI
jgi:LPXTG-motif cell wall-anchored protein